MSLLSCQRGKSEGLGLLSEGSIVLGLLSDSLGLELLLAGLGCSLSGGDLGGRLLSLSLGTCGPFGGLSLGLFLLLLGFCGSLCGKLSNKFLLFDLILKGSLSLLGSGFSCFSSSLGSLSLRLSCFLGNSLSSGFF
jgi:hypothetical protein